MFRVAAYIALAAASVSAECELPGSDGCDIKAANADAVEQMLQARDMPEADDADEPPPPPYTTQIRPTRRVLTADERATFEREGYVILRQFFSSEEMDLVRSCLQSDPLILGKSGRNISVVDASGRDTRSHHRAPMA